MSHVLIKKNMKKETLFQLHRALVYTLLGLSYAMVCFLRNAPSIVAEEMAIDLNVTKSNIGIFNSVYYFSYGIVQPFIGLMVDVIEPGYIIGITQIIAAAGTIICGQSKLLSVSIVGRVLVGLGSGPTYAASNRCMVNWFTIKNYALMLGIYHALGSLGYLFAQGPLAYIAGCVGWRSAFTGLGITGAIVGALDAALVRGNPVAFKYEAVNEATSENAPDMPVSEKLRTLWYNFKCISRSVPFWVLVSYSFTTNGAFYNVNGMWGPPFLTDVYGYSEQSAANVMMVMTVSGIVGSVAVPIICRLLLSRESSLLLSAILSAAVTALFCIPWQIGFYWLCVLFFLFSFVSSVCSILYALAVDFFDPRMAGSVVGLMNVFTFFVSAVYQAASSAILDHFGFAPGSETKYTREGYMWGLWVFSAVSYGVGAVAAFVLRFLPKPAAPDTEIIVSNQPLLESVNSTE